MQPRAAGKRTGRGALDMRHATACRHPADIARLHVLFGAKAVLVQDLAFEQVRQRRQADMRVLAYVHAMAWGVVRFEHMVEEHERADTAALGRGQRAQNRLALDRLGTWADDQGAAHEGLQAGCRCSKHSGLPGRAELLRLAVGLPCSNQEKEAAHDRQNAGWRVVVRRGVPVGAGA
jgi:hypothetical protein